VREDDPIEKNISSLNHEKQKKDIKPSGSRREGGSPRNDQYESSCSVEGTIEELDRALI